MSSTPNSATVAERTSYSAFGLRITSDVACPEFLPGTGGEEEVSIRKGAVPRCLRQPWSDGQYFEVEGDRFLLRIPETAAFLVERGCEITVEVPPVADPDDWRIFLLGSAFGILLHQRGRLPLHGSALLGRRGAFILTGPTGIGKSTLAAVLSTRGLPVLSDDVCAVSVPATGGPLLHPSYPRLHLCPDVIGAVGAPAGSLAPARKAIEKYGLDVRPSFAGGPALLRAIFLLEAAPVDRPEAELLTGMRKVLAIAENTYRQLFLQPMGLLGTHFNQITAVARSARVYRVRRPERLSGLQPLADLIVDLEAASVPEEGAAEPGRAG